MESKIARDKWILFYYFFLGMKKFSKHLYIWKYILLIWILGICILGIWNTTNAQGVVSNNSNACDTCKTNYWNTNVDWTYEGEDAICGSICAPTTSDPTTSDPANECTTKANSDTDNAAVGLTSCNDRYKNNSTSLAACETQFAEQTKMIATTKTTCLAAAACTACQANMCEWNTTDTTSNCKKSCDTECWTTNWGANAWAVMWITINPECLKNGQCGLNIYDLLGMKGKNTSATIFVQDVLLSATLFIGTIITIALIYSGIMYIMAGVNGKDPTTAKNGITYSIIGLLLVISSYTIIRLVQYIAKGL